MPRVGFMLKVKKDKIAEYERLHTQVWPEMLAALRAAGWRNYSLFLHENGLLFGYFETPQSLQAAQEIIEQTEVNTKWQAMMAPYFEMPAGEAPARMMIELEEVFHLD